jgi:hypothetical protein
MPPSIFIVTFLARLSDAGCIAFSNQFLVRKIILVSDFVSLFLSRCANSCFKKGGDKPEGSFALEFARVLCLKSPRKLNTNFLAQYLWGLT